MLTGYVAFLLPCTRQWAWYTREVNGCSCISCGQCITVQAKGCCFPAQVNRCIPVQVNGYCIAAQFNGCSIPAPAQVNGYCIAAQFNGCSIPAPAQVNGYCIAAQGHEWNTPFTKSMETASLSKSMDGYCMPTQVNWHQLRA